MLLLTRFMRTRAFFIFVFNAVVLSDVFRAHLTLSLFVSAMKCLTWRYIYCFSKYPKIYDVSLRFTLFLMIKLQLMLIYDTDIVTTRLFWMNFNCRYNPRMDYSFCLLTLKSSTKWRSPLFGATCNFNHQILPYGILFLTFINTNVFYLLPFKFSR